MQIEFDKFGTRLYQTGISHCVLYVQEQGLDRVWKYRPESEDKYIKNFSNFLPGVAWNGVTSLTESPEGAEITPIYADNIKYLNLISREDFKASIEAYTYPNEFAVCDGTAILDSAAGLKIHGQTRSKFALVFKTNIGSDIIDANDPNAPYMLHIIYNCRAGVSDSQYQTINDSPEAMTFSWDIETDDDEYVKLIDPSYNNAVHLTIRSDEIADEDIYKLRILEGLLYGCDNFVANAAYKKGTVVLKPTATSGLPTTARELLYVNKDTTSASLTTDTTKLNVSIDDWATGTNGASAFLPPSNVVYEILANARLFEPEETE